jgi:hypothetical protein
MDRIGKGLNFSTEWIAVDWNNPDGIRLDRTAPDRIGTEGFEFFRGVDRSGLERIIMDWKAVERLEFSVVRPGAE